MAINRKVKYCMCIGDTVRRLNYADPEEESQSKWIPE